MSNDNLILQMHSKKKKETTLHQQAPMSINENTYQTDPRMSHTLQNETEVKETFYQQRGMSLKKKKTENSKQFGKEEINDLLNENSIKRKTPRNSKVSVEDDHGHGHSHADGSAGCAPIIMKA